METMKRFLDYYTAFEATYVDDDWSRLEPLFDPDAVYSVKGSGSYDCELRGRDAVFAGIRRFLDGFDRRCTRRLESGGVPVVDGNRVSFHGAAIYTRGDSPPMRLELREVIEFGADGRIVRITDHYDAWKDGPPAELRDWPERHAKDLTLSYA
jgi:hypothetical protein